MTSSQNWEKLKKFCLKLQGRIFLIFRSYFGLFENFIFSFWNFLTFSEDIMFIVHLEEQYLAFKKWLLTRFYLLFRLLYFNWNRSSYLEGKASGLHYMLDQTRSSHFSFSLAIYVSPPRQPTLAEIANFCPIYFLNFYVLDLLKSDSNT